MASPSLILSQATDQALEESMIITRIKKTTTAKFSDFEANFPFVSKLGAKRKAVHSLQQLLGEKVLSKPHLLLQQCPYKQTATYSIHSLH